MLRYILQLTLENIPNFLNKKLTAASRSLRAAGAAKQ